MHLVGSHGGAQLLDDGLRHDGPAVAKMDHATNAPGVADPAEAGRQVKPREQVIREQGLGEPHRPAPGGALEPDARQVNLEVRFLLQVRRRNVLVLGLRAKAKPRRRCVRAEVDQPIGSLGSSWPQPSSRALSQPSTITGGKHKVQTRLCAD